MRPPSQPSGTVGSSVRPSSAPANAAGTAVKTENGLPLHNGPARHLLPTPDPVVSLSCPLTLLPMLTLALAMNFKTDPDFEVNRPHSAEVNHCRGAP